MNLAYLPRHDDHHQRRGIRSLHPSVQEEWYTPHEDQAASRYRIIMGFDDALFAIAILSAVEGYLLQHTVFLDDAFRTVCIGAFGVNLVLKAIWDMLVFPFCVNPLRHLPQAPVSLEPAFDGHSHINQLGLFQQCQNHL